MKGARILLADDHKMLGNALKELLERLFRGNNEVNPE
jgi:hypothetical protein